MADQYPTVFGSFDWPWLPLQPQTVAILKKTYPCVLQLSVWVKIEGSQSALCLILIICHHVFFQGVYCRKRRGRGLALCGVILTASMQLRDFTLIFQQELLLLERVHEISRALGSQEQTQGVLGDSVCKCSQSFQRGCPKLSGFSSKTILSCFEQTTYEQNLKKHIVGVAQPSGQRFGSVNDYFVLAIIAFDQILQDFSVTPEQRKSI